MLMWRDHPLLVIGLGVGVQRTRLRSFSLASVELPSHRDILSIASALLAAAVPIAVLSSSLFPAGVSAPTASALLGVHVGGGIAPFVTLLFPGVRDIPGKPRSPALARRLFEALFESLCEMRSREDGAGRWKGVVGGGSDDSAGSSDWERMRGVARRVPKVISCLTAAGPSSEGVGDGIEGTSEKPLSVGDFGRYGVPVMAASIRLRVGLGGADIDLDGASSCSGSRVFVCLTVLGGPLASTANFAAD